MKNLSVKGMVIVSNVMMNSYTIENGKVKRVVKSYDVSSLYPNKIVTSSMYGKFSGGVTWLRNAK